MLQFKDVSAQEGTLKSIGTVAQFVGKDGYHELASDKNFKGTMKESGKLTNVTIALVNAKGQKAFVNCSGPVSADLRATTSAKELETKIIALASFPILELPQADEDGAPIMDLNEETGLEEQRIIYSISFAGGTDMSKTRVNITADMLKLESVKRTIDWNELVAL